MLPNLSAKEVMETLSPLIPQHIRLLMTVDAQIKAGKLQLRAVKCLRSFTSLDKDWLAGSIYQAWFYSIGKDYYIVFPGQKKAHIVSKHYWQPLEEAEILHEMEISRQLNILKTHTEIYQLMVNSDDVLQLVPQWWLDAKKVIGCYYLNLQSVKYCLQLVEYQGKQMLSWRFVSLFPTAQIQWFSVEFGRFFELTEVNPLKKFAPEKESRYLGHPLNVTDGILKFIY